MLLSSINLCMNLEVNTILEVQKLNQEAGVASSLRFPVIVYRKLAKLASYSDALDNIQRMKRNSFLPKS